jgi:two-component system chemotaxis response regulator CheY
VPDQARLARLASPGRTDVSDCEGAPVINKKLKVLVVDDARVARQILKNMLKELGITDVVEADDGTTALEALKSNKVNLVLSDWNMPSMSGLELLKKVRASSGLASLPFVMVTAERMEQNIVEAVQAGVSGYIKKPFGAQELEKKIRQALRLE